MSHHAVVPRAFSLVLIGLSAASMIAQNSMSLPPQRRPSEAQTNSVGGAASGPPRPAVLDSQHRPITAGGTVRSGPTVFTDITSTAGLGGWRHVMGTPQKKYLLETIGSGVGLLDYDRDGWLDIYLVNGSTYEALAGQAKAPRAGLFHNNHDGTFTDVTERAGVSNERWGFGVVVGDYDNDGWPDIFVSNFGRNRLYHNNKDGTFTDVAETAGVALGNWSTGATWGDYDGDGYLDLFVPGYVHYDVSSPPASGAQGVTYGFCQFRGVDVSCGPRGLRGESDHLFHNKRDGTFSDASDAAGVSDPPRYYGLASAFVDINGDGLLDLIVADDSTPNYLYVNRGTGKFEDASYVSGYALNEAGRETASMGIAIGDMFHSGRVDLFNTTFSDDYKPLYRNDGDASFTDVSYSMGIAEATIPFLGWGTAFLDFDNDGWLDLFETNGHLYKEVDHRNWGTSWKQRPLLFHNSGGKLKLMPAVEGTGLAESITGRGVAIGDLFNDGRIDVVINNLEGAPTLLRNASADRNHWVELKLTGGPKAPCDAVGTTAYLSANGFRQRQDVIAGGSFASSSDQRLHFGLGPAESVVRLEIHWPDGKVENVDVSGVDAIYEVTEGTGRAVRSSANSKSLGH